MPFRRALRGAEAESASPRPVSSQQQVQQSSTARARTHSKPVALQHVSHAHISSRLHTPAASLAQHPSARRRECAESICIPESRERRGSLPDPRSPPRMDVFPPYACHHRYQRNASHQLSRRGSLTSLSPLPPALHACTRCVQPRCENKPLCVGMCVGCPVHHVHVACQHHTASAHYHSAASVLSSPPLHHRLGRRRRRVDHGRVERDAGKSRAAAQGVAWRAQDAVAINGL